MNDDILFRDEVYAIQGAIFEVNRIMGAGFLEAVYQDCLAKEFTLRGIPFVAQQELQLTYKGQTVNASYKPDFVCFGCLIVELKALSQTTGEHQAQVMNYLKAAGYRLGLLVNFGAHPKTTVQRIIL